MLHISIVVVVVVVVKIREYQQNRSFMNDSIQIDGRRRVEFACKTIIGTLTEESPRIEEIDGWIDR